MSKVEEHLLELNPENKVLIPWLNEHIEEVKRLAGLHAFPKVDHKTTVLITYGDQFQSKDKSGFENLKQFLKHDLEGVISHVHILPFYPSTSDDGFSPVCYKDVATENGSWQDFEQIEAYKMVDCVFNHVSQQNEMFQKALNGDEAYKKMFHFFSKEEFATQKFQSYIPKVVRPRTSELFTAYDVKGEENFVWTTFSPDQVDINLENPEMLKYVLESFFHYIKMGSQFFRIDAIPFVWKELGSNCSHLPKAHTFVKLLRSLVEEVDSKMLIITESNVPHIENISYWGEGDEAHLIYNFSLSPLILHALVNQTNTVIHKWSQDVFGVDHPGSFFNFTASHDGIGMRGLEGIVPDDDVKALVELAQRQGGEIGLKRSRDGTVRPYELNITWASILKDTNLSQENSLKKLVSSHGLVMFYPGVAAHYVHNFFGSENWTQGLHDSGIRRRINRKKFDYPLSLTEYQDLVKAKTLELIKFKQSEELFGVDTKFESLDLDKELICFRRYNDNASIIVCFNLTSEDKTIQVDGFKLELLAYDLKFIKDGEVCFSLL